jgi:hypothetical protein
LFLCFDCFIVLSFGRFSFGGLVIALSIPSFNLQLHFVDEVRNDKGVWEETKATKKVLHRRHHPTQLPIL